MLSQESHIEHLRALDLCSRANETLHRELEAGLLGLSDPSLAGKLLEPGWGRGGHSQGEDLWLIFLLQATDALDSSQEPLQECRDPR